VFFVGSAGVLHACCSQFVNAGRLLLLVASFLLFSTFSYFCSTVHQGVCKWSVDRDSPRAANPGAHAQTFAASRGHQHRGREGALSIWLLQVAIVSHDGCQSKTVPLFCHHKKNKNGLALASTTIAGDCDSRVTMYCFPLFSA